jgi:flavin-dependent dehydrogenase
LSRTHDVAVVGGGPAGLAVAGLLAQRGRAVAVFERNDYRAARVGETFGGEIGPLLDAIGAGEALRELVGGQVPFLSIRSAWGADQLAEHDSILHPLGAGVHVDRARFDERLATWARSAGAEVHAGVGRCSIARDADEVVVSSQRGPTVRARFLLFRRRQRSGRAGLGRDRRAPLARSRPSGRRGRQADRRARRRR